MISLVPREQVMDIWPTVAPMLEKALEYAPGRYELIDVFTDIVTGAQTLWISFDETKAIKACCTIRINSYPLTKVLNVELLGGEGVDEWLDDAQETMMRYAKDMGCSIMECRGRPGWGPRIKKYGWDNKAVHFECKVER